MIMIYIRKLLLSAPLLLLLVLLLGIPSGNGNSDDDDESSSSSSSWEVRVNVTTGSASVMVDQWFSFSLHPPKEVLGWNNNNGNLQLLSADITHGNYDAALKAFGPYTNYRFCWQEEEEEEEEEETNTTHKPRRPRRRRRQVETSYWVFEEHDMVIFEQVFPNGWTNNNINDASSSSPPDYFGASSIVMGFPSIDTNIVAITPEEEDDDNDLGYLVWGDCFAAFADHGTSWKSLNDEELQQRFNGHTHGQPWLLHDHNSKTTDRAVVWSNLDNFFVSGFAYDNTTSSIQVGLRNTLQSVPNNFRHRSVLVSSSGSRNGITSTMMKWGDVLLAYGGANKKRTNVYDDFVLAHVGYFTDNGAYHYMAAHEPEYANMEEALLGVKNGLWNEQNKVPIRYMQWDDWWMESDGDMPGMTSWQPQPTIFPSGFSNWLDMPLSLYAPGYSGRNVWIHDNNNDYDWKITNNTSHGGFTAIPTDVEFYKDLFRNGTQIGMTLFEQDFLCSYGIGGTGLTSTDVDAGSNWLRAMNDAALAYNVSVQLCMVNTYHLMFSTTLPRVTNARATGDNTRNYDSITTMGQNGLLFYALGIFASRDNVWTSSADVEQKGCGNRDFCYEPNAHLDNVVTVLSNGPYGIADAVHYVNRDLVLYACRSTDGYMLRPRVPLMTLDFVFTDLLLVEEEEEEEELHVWAAHDDHGPYRWSYVVGVNLTQSVLLTPERLLGSAHSSSDDAPPPPPQRQLVAWQVIPGTKVSQVVLSPFMLPKSEPLDLPYDVDAPSHTHFSTAPVLSNGMVLLGETGKWATMSFGRVVLFQEEEEKNDDNDDDDDDDEGVVITIVLVIAGAPSETVEYSYMNDIHSASTIDHVTHVFPHDCPDHDAHGNVVCQALLTCNVPNGCEFHNTQHGGGSNTTTTFSSSSWLRKK